MDGVRLLGQVLLWLGFLSAAFVSVCQKEVEFLPRLEQDSLKMLNHDASITQAELDEMFATPVVEMDSDQFSELANKLGPIFKKRAAEKAEAEKNPKPEPETQDKAEEEQEDETKSAEQLAAEKRANRKLSKDYFEEKRVLRIENRWPTVPWVWYGLSMVVGIAGVVLLRSSNRTTQEDTSRVDEEYAMINSSLKLLRERVGNLKSNLAEMKPAQVVMYIDSECAEPFSDFAEARNALVQRFGLQAFADVMTQFSSGERFVNRAWSASADGYVNEAKDCIDRAFAHLEKAGQLIKGFESNKA